MKIKNKKVFSEIVSIQRFSGLTIRKTYETWQSKQPFLRTKIIS